MIGAIGEGVMRAFVRLVIGNLRDRIAEWRAGDAGHGEMLLLRIESSWCQASKHGER